MVKILDYADYLNARRYAAVTERTLAFVRILYPKIEATIKEEIEKITQSEPNDADETIITSLCFILSEYLINLTSRPNNFNITQENVGLFVTNIINGMLKNIKDAE